jgi:hypothetical protein
LAAIIKVIEWFGYHFGEARNSRFQLIRVKR